MPRMVAGSGGSLAALAWAVEGESAARDSRTGAPLAVTQPGDLGLFTPPPPTEKATVEAVRDWNPALPVDDHRWQNAPPGGVSGFLRAAQTVAESAG